ncbi:hypothetical protein MNBD_BACTEROID02-202 [hydrothermal vent metagenome]|jgi:hypothetical protein|uniref:Outer membrane protein beta-barrel domain-containing protein n=1 Tax=hydrothermal vent metagenome TaxID=652676 RepID=A0A3B0RNG3_9ZZZZ
MSTLKQFIFISILLSLFFFNESIYAQFSIGTSYGIQIPGRQDLKFRRYQDGVLQENIKTTEVHSTPSPILNINATYWMKKYGLRLDYYSWEHRSAANEFETNELPPFYRIVQGRDAIFFSILRKSRFPFLSKEDSNKSKKYSFFGIGIGETLTEVEQGRTQWRAAFKLSYSLSVPVTKKLNALFEFKYLLTRDIDTLPNKNGWFVDTSGRWFPFRFGPHWDTRYYVFQLGLQWNLFN